MSIIVRPNPRYVNGTSAHDKYNPIEQPFTLDKKDHGLFSRMLSNRITSLEYSGYETSSLCLQLAVKNKETLIKGLNGKAPPLIVVSSRRADWIRKGLVNCDAILNSLGINQFNDVMDLRALRETVRNRPGYPSPPIYSPNRLGPSANRNVYIVVHFNEYATYCLALMDYPITVVGWNFRGLPLYPTTYDIKKPPKNSWATLAGFGASRFAAIEFAKMLYRLSGGLTRLAWYFDDNVVGMSDKFMGLKYYEDSLKTVDPCQGFAALPVNQTRGWIIDWAAGGGKDPRKNPGDSPKSPIFQQAVLWNIAYLAGKNLNFGLTYVASAEDVSLSRFMTVEGLPWWFVQSVAILKETPSDSPNDPGAQNVVQAKKQFEEIFATIESLDLPGQPAVKVDVSVSGKLETMKIRDFASKFVTKGSNNNAGLSDRAACQVVEQITKLAIGLGLVNQAAVDTFMKVRVQTELRASD